MPLDDGVLDRIERAHRQVLLAEWGAAGQERIAAATVHVAGAGPAARAAALYLAGAGVGAIRVEDGALAARIGALNPHVRVSRGPAESPSGAALTVEELGFSLRSADDREASGALLALACLKALLALPHPAPASGEVAAPRP